MLNTLLTLVVVVFLLRLLMPAGAGGLPQPRRRGRAQDHEPARAAAAAGAFRPGRRFDVASLLALLIVHFVKTIVLLLVRGATLRLDTVIVAGLYGLVITVIQFYFYAVLIYALHELVRRRGVTARSATVLERLCEPLLAPFRRVIPPIGGLDLSALFLMIALQAVLILLRAP